MKPKILNRLVLTFLQSRENRGTSYPRNLSLARIEKKIIRWRGMKIVKIFHFVEIQLTYCLYLQIGMAFFN